MSGQFLRATAEQTASEARGQMRQRRAVPPCVLWLPSRASPMCCRSRSIVLGATFVTGEPEQQI